jgi:hypothetical protein
MFISTRTLYMYGSTSFKVRADSRANLARREPPRSRPGACAREANAKYQARVPSESTWDASGKNQASEWHIPGMRVARNRLASGKYMDASDKYQASKWQVPQKRAASTRLASGLCQTSEWQVLGNKSEGSKALLNVEALAFSFTVRVLCFPILQLGYTTSQVRVRK